MGQQMPLSFDDWADQAMPPPFGASLPGPCGNRTLSASEMGKRIADWKRSRKSDPQTSKQAAHSVRSVASDHHLRIIGALYMPATATEIAAATGLTMVQCARRLPELQALKLVRPTGKTRATASGRQSREWERVK